MRLLVGYLLLFALLTQSACASLDNLTRRAAQAQREAAALVMALDGYLESCEGQEAPETRGCAEARRLREAMEPAFPVGPEGAD